VSRAERIAKERRAGDEHVDAVLRRAGDRGRTHAAVDLEVDDVGQSRVIDHRPHGSHLRLHGRDVALTAETRVDGHDQHEVDEIEHLGDDVRWRRRVERDAGRRTELADVAQRPMQVQARLGMHDQP